MSVAKIIELMGSSSKGFEDALEQVIKRGCKTIRHVRGVEVISQNIKLSEDGSREYRVNVKISFRIEN
ncbi:MAG: dodecin family protein [Parcubacteria group bacterium]